MEKVHTFEEESVEDMKRETEKKNLSSNDERIHRTAERTDAILNRVSHLTQLEFTLKEEIRELEHKMKNMDSRHVTIFLLIFLKSCVLFRKNK